MLVEKRCVYHVYWFYTLFSVSKELHMAFYLELSCKITISIQRDLVPIEELVYGYSCFFDVAVYKHHSFSGHSKNWAPEKQCLYLKSPDWLPEGLCQASSLVWPSPGGPRAPEMTLHTLTPPNSFPPVISILWHCSASGLEHSAFLGYCSDWFRWVTPNMNSVAS